MKYVRMFSVVMILVLALCTGAFAAWQVEDVGFKGDCVSLAVDASGTPHISSYGLRYTTKAGGIWQSQIVDNTMPAPSLWANTYNTSIALDSAGKPRISYADGANHNLKYAALNGTTWQIKAVVPTGIGSNQGVFNSLALYADSTPFISYSLFQTMQCATLVGDTWQVANPSGVSNGTGGYSSAQIDANGNPHVSYGKNEQLRYASYNGTIWTSEVVPGTSGNVRWSSLELDSNGYPCISFQKWDSAGSDYALGFARWNGTSWNVQTVVTGSIGNQTSLELDASGNPWISYYDAGNSRTKVAHWNGTSWQIDSLGDSSATEFSALAMDATGNAHVVFTDRSLNLKYASWEPVPEPSSFLALGSGLLGLAGLARRRK